jgi:hypothetical protein
MKESGTRTFRVTVPVEIEVTASGYYDPGVLDGPPERCYPPEGEITSVLMVEIVDDDDVRSDLLDNPKVYQAWREAKGGDDGSAG